MRTLDELLRGLEASPNDDDLRRVLADHLLETDEAAWGEMLVLALDKPTDPVTAEYASRYASDWKALLKGLVHHVQWNADGFHVSLRWDKLDQLRRAMALLPIRTVKVLRFGATWDAEKLRSIADAPELQHVARLEFVHFFDRPCGEQLRVLLDPPHRFTHLRSLAIAGEELDEPGARALAGYPWPQLEELDVESSLRPGGLRTLLHDCALRRLLFTHRLDDDDLTALADAPHVAFADKLRLGPISSAGIAAFGRASHLSLRSLVLTGIPNLPQLLAAPHLRESLRSIRIDTRVDVTCVRAIAEADLPNLEQVSIYGAGDAEAIALAAARQPKLSYVSVRPRVGNAGAQALATSALPLTEIDAGSAITDHGARMLATRANLVALHLKDNAISNVVKAELRKKLGAGVCKFSR